MALRMAPELPGKSVSRSEFGWMSRAPIDDQPPYAGEGGAFILPSMVGASPEPNPTAERATKLPQRDGMRFRPSGTIPAGEMHEKILRLRRERREIDDAMDARQTIRLHFGDRQFDVRRGLRVRGEQRRASPRNQIERGDSRVVGLSVADHWREHRDIDLRLRRQRPAGRQMLVVAGRPCIVSGEEP